MYRRKFLKIASSTGVGMLIFSTAYTKTQKTHNNNVVADLESLFKGFRYPPTSSWPFVYWFWNGNVPTEQEVARELDVMKSAGIGGAMIIATSMPHYIKDKHTPLIWIGDEWMKIAKFTVDAASERDMYVYFVAAAGWPFGGPGLNSGETSQIVLVKKKELTGPLRFKAVVSDLFPESHVRGNLPPRYDSNYPTSKQSLFFLRLFPKNMEIFQPGIELIDKVDKEDILEIDIPEGDHILAVGTWQENWQYVRNGVPGGDGTVLNHMNKQATNKYLSRISSKFKDTFGDKLPDNLLGFCCDSLEEYGANWTNGFYEEFENRRGYSLKPFLPLILEEVHQRGNLVKIRKYTGKLTPYEDTISRVQHDFHLTKLELFVEGFAQPYMEWCKNLGVKSWVEAYGRLWHELEGSMMPDVPAGETWLDPGKNSDLYVRSTIVNKYVSSGAHLAGRREVANEAMTQMPGTFRATLEHFKEANDDNFIAGNNHSFVNDYNYSPSDVPYPGWIKFGSYFNERNPLWKHIHLWFKYDSRLTWIFTNSVAQTNIAILPPKKDKMSFEGLVEHPQTAPQHIWYEDDLWRGIHSNGHCADYISEKILKEASFENGKINYGDRKYEALILMDVKTLSVDVAYSLKQYSEAGGRILFIGDKPFRSPGLKSAKLNDKMIQELIGKMFAKNNGNIKQVIAPNQDEDLTLWIKHAFKAFELDAPVSIDTPMANVSQIQYRCGENEIFFFVNSSREETATFVAEFKTGNKTPWVWNPETGEKKVYPYESSKNKLKIVLPPLASLLLIYDPANNSIEPKSESTRGLKVKDLETSWSLTMYPVEGEKFERNFSMLIDFSTDDQLKTFGGTVVYKCTFDIKNENYDYISLGKVKGVAEVFINGKSLGVNWWGEKIFDMRECVKKGENQLKVELVTPVFNHLKARKDFEGPRGWRKQDGPISLGVLGPVKLYQL